MSDAMSVTQIKEHCLVDFMRRAPVSEEAAVHVELEPGVGHFVVRGDASSESLVTAFEASLGQSLPTPGRVSRAEHRIYWMGPTEWLIVSEQSDGGEAVRRLRASLAELHAAVTDVSGGQILLSVSGSAARDLLSKGATLDLHERVFKVDRCAQSTLARSGALFALRDGAPSFELIIRRSFADYSARWLLTAGQEFGVSFGEKTV